MCQCRPWDHSGVLVAIFTALDLDLYRAFMVNGGLVPDKSIDFRPHSVPYIRLVPGPTNKRSDSMYVAALIRSNPFSQDLLLCMLLGKKWMFQNRELRLSNIGSARFMQHTFPTID
jgi:hypothetical protein